MIYHYFEDKAGLYEAVARHNFTRYYRLFEIGKSKPETCHQSKDYMLLLKPTYWRSRDTLAILDTPGGNWHLVGRS